MTERLDDNCQFWLDGMENTLGSYLKKKSKTSTDLIGRQFHYFSYLDLRYLRENLEGKVDDDPDVRQTTTYVGDCCMLAFFKYGFIHFS